MSMRWLFSVWVACALVGCADGPVEYAAENSGGILHQISTDPSEIFRNKVDREAGLEARGVEPPVGNASWREYWTKMIAYCATQRVWEPTSRSPLILFNNDAPAVSHCYNPRGS